MIQPHEHRPSYWRYQFHRDKSDPHNRTGKHTLVCRHCGQKICKQRSTLPWWLLIPAAAFLLLMHANEDFFRSSPVLIASPLALVFLLDYYDFRTKRYMLLEEYEAMIESTEAPEKED